MDADDVADVCPEHSEDTLVEAGFTFGAQHPIVRDKNDIIGLIALSHFVISGLTPQIHTVLAKQLGSLTPEAVEVFHRSASPVLWTYRDTIYASDVETAKLRATDDPVYLNIQTKLDYAVANIASQLGRVEVLIEQRTNLWKEFAFSILSPLVFAIIASAIVYLAPRLEFIRAVAVTNVPAQNSEGMKK